MKPIALLPLLLTLFCKVNAKNNWTQPCFNGSCSYDIANNGTSMGGTFSIVGIFLIILSSQTEHAQSGSATSISDITPAAGWDVLNCTTSTNSQTIQLVCTDEAKGCTHLFQKGAEHTIVRLPEDVCLPFIAISDYLTKS